MAGEHDYESDNNSRDDDDKEAEHSNWILNGIVSSDAIFNDACRCNCGRAEGASSLTIATTTAITVQNLIYYDTFL